MSAKSLPVHWLYLWSNTGHLQVLYWVHRCLYLMSWTSPRPCWHYLLDLGGRYSVLLYFFLTLKWCWGYNLYPSSGGDSLGVRGSSITWVLCFLPSWQKGMDLGKKPKDLSSLPLLLSQTTDKCTSMEHPIPILVISASIRRKRSSQLTVGNGSFQELFGTVLVCMSINQPGTVLMFSKYGSSSSTSREHFLALLNLVPQIKPETARTQ